jgi:hypothetical protein
MKTTATVAAFTSLLSAASAQYFGLTAARSASPIHYQTLTASGQSIWLNKATSAYCPENIEELGGCPSGDFTTFAGGESTLAMGVVVPGGQEVYIEPETGAVKYTIAHSVAKPEGSIVTGWSTAAGNGFGILSNEAGGFLACPCEEEEGAWKVFAALEGLEFDDECLGFSALASNATDAGAWQYN